MIATLWQCHPAATNMQVIAAVQQSASQSSNPDSLLGYGIPNFPQACIYLGELTHSGIHGDDLTITGANPFNTSLDFTFSSDSNQLINIRLYDLLGKLVYKNISDYNKISFNKKFSIAANTLRNGMYVLQVVTERGIFSKKVVKY